MAIEKNDWKHPLVIISILGMLASGFGWFYADTTSNSKDQATYITILNDTNTKVSSLVDSVETIRADVTQLKTATATVSQRVTDIDQNFRSNDASLNSRILNLEQEMMHGGIMQRGRTFDGHSELVFPDITKQSG